MSDLARCLAATSEAPSGPIWPSWALGARASEVFRTLGRSVVLAPPGPPGALLGDLRGSLGAPLTCLEAQLGASSAVAGPIGAISAASRLPRKPPWRPRGPQ
eukprot:1184638-Pyramimonas_sp.AAC.1